MSILLRDIYSDDCCYGVVNRGFKEVLKVINMLDKEVYNEELVVQNIIKTMYNDEDITAEKLDNALKFIYCGKDLDKYTSDDVDG